MTKLVWDKAGQRLYEIGIDRGVLYLSDNTGVAWNGLTSIDEDTGDDKSEPVYFDGMKFMDNQSYGDYAATLKAFTYPDAFLEYEGVGDLGGGLYVGDQQPKLFGLAYRTLVGNDIEGSDFGYKVHLVYNITAVPDAKAFETLSNGSAPTEFSWQLTTIPEKVDGYRPTAHVILDSRYLPADILAVIESILYGTDGGLTVDIIYDGGYPGSTDPDLIDGGGPSDEGDELPGTEETTSGEPRLPSIPELIDLITLFSPRFILPNPDTGLAELIFASGDLTQTLIPGVYTALPTTRLGEVDVEGFYQLDI